jgi:hypothetical protein
MLFRVPESELAHPLVLWKVRKQVAVDELIYNGPYLTELIILENSIWPLKLADDLKECHNKELL